jgi:glycosyltransferase involved in cell wall biosynthesis
MNIVLLHFSAPPVVGGVETVLEHQAEQLDRAGHRVRILAGRGQTWDARIPVEVLARLDIRHPQTLKVKASLDAGTVPDQFAGLVQQIQSDLQRSVSSAQVVIAHNVASLNKNLALTAALYNLWQDGQIQRLILWQHDLAWTTQRYQDELHPGWPWDLLRTAWPGAKQVTVSEARRQELANLLKISPQEITVIPAGLDMTSFLGLQPRTVDLMDNLQLSQAAPILLTPVRVTRRKNLEMAFTTLAALRKDLPRAALVVTGTAGTQNPSNQEYLDHLLKLRSDLELEGSAHLLAEFAPEGLPEASLADFYRLADALFLPSKEEGFGFPILEAGLSRLPIFCSDLPALRDLAGHYATYFSVDDTPKNVAKLIAKQLKLDPVYRLRVHLRQEYTWQSIYHRQIAPLLEG